MSTLPLMTQTELETCEIIADEAGFGAMQTADGNLPLKQLDVDARIVGLVATTTVRQTYVNNHARPLEATYIFPLPHRGAVVDFKMIVNDRVIDGVLKERGEARREYREAIEAGHRASIVEEERPDVFTMRAGNIAPGEEATIEVTIVVPLVYVAGEATFRFPLVVAPRYIPGQPLDGPSVGAGTAPDTDAVPDASRISPPVLLPGFPNPVRLNLRASIDRRQFEIGDVKSSLHAVKTIENKGQIDIVVDPGERLNRDFILRFEIAQDQIATQLVTIPDDDKNGTFVLTVIPPKPVETKKNRDVIFVLDRSGSMGGWKMVAARRAVGRMIDTLNQGDQFQVLAFDTVVERCPVGEGLLEATNRNRYRTIEWLSKVDARGGTEMAEPLMDAIQMMSGNHDDRERFVVLITDGQVGNEQQIISNVRKGINGYMRVFTVGIDQGVNASFLDQLAKAGSGRCELIESEDRLDDVMDRLHHTINTPVVTELAVSFDGATLVRSTVTPRHANALFGDAPLVLSGRYSGKETFGARLSGAFADGSLFTHEVTAVKSTDARLASVWARGQIRALEDEFDSAEYNQDKRASLEAKMIATSLKYGVLSRFTSYVAVDRDHTIDSKGALHEVVQPVESPAGWEMNKSMAPPPMSAPSPQFAQSPGAAYAPTPRSPQRRKMSKKRGGVLGGAISAMKEMLPVGGSASSSGGFGAGSAQDKGGYEAEEMAAMADEVADFAELYEGEAGRTERTAINPKTGTPITWSSRTPEPTIKQEDTQAGPAPNLNTMSPDQLRPGHALTPAHDVYSLALLWVELLLGRRLFDEKTEFGVATKISQFDSSELARYSQELGPFLATLIRAMERDPNRRIADVSTLLAELNLQARGNLDLLTYAEGSLDTPAQGNLGAFVCEGLLSTDVDTEVFSATLNGTPFILRAAFAHPSADNAWVADFTSETQVSSAHVAPFASSGFDDGRAWVAFAAHARTSLAAIVRQAAKQGGLPQDVAAEVVRQVATAIELVHQSGQVYGKPLEDEFFLLENGQLVALGLGDLNPVPTTEPPSRRDTFWK